MSVSTLAGELRDCLSEMIRGPAPAPPDDVEDPQRFFRQWLAERNLRLVPIEDAGSFEWPGQWIALVRGGERQHAVVMFGSPSGVCSTPAARTPKAFRSMPA
jgi:hypothetical protein